MPRHWNSTRRILFLTLPRRQPFPQCRSRVNYEMRQRKSPSSVCQVKSQSNRVWDHQAAYGCSDLGPEGQRQTSDDGHVGEVENRPPPQIDEIDNVTTPQYV